MKRRFAPGPQLATFVRCFEVIETAEPMTRTLLPEPGLVVALRYAGTAAALETGAPRASPRCAIVGMRSSARRMQSSAGGMIVARLRPGHSERFLRAAAHELFGETCSLDQVVHPREVDRASSRIMAARSDAERIAIFEGFLLAGSERRPADPLVLRALAALDESAGCIRITALARIAGLSQDALEKRFRRAVGATPKQYASIVRLRRAIAAYETGRSLTEVAIDAGYCDQSHFNRHFRQVTGEAPRGLLASAAYC